MIIEFTVYGEPVAKGRPKFFRRGNFAGVFTPKKTKDAEYDFKVQSLKYKPDTPFTSAIKLEIRSYRSIPKSMSKKKVALIQTDIGSIQPETRPDWDNLGKLITDAGEGIFWRNDSQIVDCRIQKFYSDKPRTEVRIETNN